MTVLTYIFRHERPSTTHLGPSFIANQLRCETLEDRRMLAGIDMAQITGTVYHDINGDNLHNDTAPLNGVSVRLLADDGNNSFGPEDSTIQSVTTDGSGRYTFNGISAGRYYVQQQAPLGFIQRAGEDVRTVDITAIEAMGSNGTTIDSFSTEQIVEASPPLPASSPSSRSDGDVLGGERDLFVELTAGTDRFSAVSLISADGRLRLRSDTEVTGNARVVWDGVDDNGRDVFATGLSGVNLTEANGNTMTGILLRAGADQAGAQLRLRLYTDDSNWSEFSTTVPQTAGGAPTSQVLIEFADTPETSSGSGADYANIGAIELTFEGVSALDGQVSLIGTVGVTTKTVDFANYEPLSLGNLVWLDGNNDGRFDAGNETGIPAVKLNLYADTNLDEQFNSSVDALLAMTETDALGNYLFTDLFPGKYLVQVDESNFNAGAPLDELNSSSGNEPTPDPDDNVNQDDNGDRVAGNGVLSRNVMLLANSEPVNDEDNDSNSNLSVDFGFFSEADLALTKSVDNPSPVANERVTFTVVARNDGPATATGVVVNDPMPLGLSFVSASADQGTYDQNSGDWSIGTLQNGATATLNVVVQATLPGKKTNIAEVVAVDQFDSDSAPNNRVDDEDDQAMVMLIPQVADLSLTKTVNNPRPRIGETVTFTVDVRNDGPMPGTSLAVTDHLPPGLSFISTTASRGTYEPATGIWTIGNLAVGEEVRLQIRATVDTPGLKENTAEISSLDQFDRDSTVANFSIDEDDQDTVAIRPFAAILGKRRFLS